MKYEYKLFVKTELWPQVALTRKTRIEIGHWVHEFFNLNEWVQYDPEKEDQSLKFVFIDRVGIQNFQTFGHSKSWK